MNRLDRLLSEIADASRIDTELARAEPEAVDLVPMLETIVDIYRAQRISEGGVEIRFAAEADGRTRAVPERMAQVFRNLIDNAVSFAPPGSAVDVRLSRCNGWIEITVEDQGPGIPEDARERIFERFYTNRPEPTPFGTHSGLGLAISRQIVESHRGRISCENRHDTSGAVSGARFTVLLPASNTAAPGRNP